MSRLKTTREIVIAEALSAGSALGPLLPGLLHRIIGTADRASTDHTIPTSDDIRWRHQRGRRAADILWHLEPGRPTSGRVPSQYPVAVMFSMDREMVVRRKEVGVQEAVAYALTLDDIDPAVGVPYGEVMYGVHRGGENIFRSLDHDPTTRAVAMRIGPKTLAAVPGFVYPDRGFIPVTPHNFVAEVVALTPQPSDQHIRSLPAEIPLV